MSLINLDFSRLPYEITNRISKHLDSSSLANCSLVNKHWHACFISDVWKTPKINSLAHLKSFNHSLQSIASLVDEEESQENSSDNNDQLDSEKSSSFTDSYNHLKKVRNLDLTTVVDEFDINDSDSVQSFDYADSQTKSLLTDLSCYCSDLKSLTLKVPSERNSSKDAPNFFFTLQQFLKTALSLEILNLDFNDMTVFSDHLVDSIPVECLSKLHTLNLQNATMVDDGAFIWFWSNCPSLTSITISQSSSLNDYVLYPLIRVHGDKIKVFNLERCSRLSVNSLLNIIVNCKNLETLKWVNNGASLNNNLLSTSSSDFQVDDVPKFLKALKESCSITNLKELEYSFLQESQATIIFDFLIENNRESIESIKCQHSQALISAAQKNIIYPRLKKISFNNINVSLKDLSKSNRSIDGQCQSLPSSYANNVNDGRSRNLII